MAKVRLQRVAEQLQQEISALVTKGIKDPRIGFVTITGVEVSPDLAQAWVFFATPGDATERQRSLAGLQSAAGFIRKTLGRRLRLKNIPEFQFKYDESFDRGDRIERLLADLKQASAKLSAVRGSAGQVAEALRAGGRYLITTHTNPDGDAVASLLGARLIIEKLGGEAVSYSVDPVPHNFRFLPGADQIASALPPIHFNFTLVLDSSELDRCSPLPDAGSRGQLVSIDHHLTPQPLGDIFFLDPSASSIGEMLVEVIDELHMEIDSPLATCLYTSILADTGSFRYSNTSPRALRAAARMLEAGVSPWEVAFQVYESQPRERMELLGLVLPTLRLDANGRIASIVITREAMVATGATLDMIDGFINYPRGIQGVEVAIQLRQTEDGKVKVSFRSGGRVDVSEVARLFGGGGHRNAAGCTLGGTLDEVRERVVRATATFLEQ